MQAADLPTGFMLSLLVVVLFILLLIFATKILRLPVPGRVLVVLPYLLAVGMFMYPIVPLVSIVALTSGFGLALALLMLQLSKPPK